MSKKDTHIHAWLYVLAGVGAGALTGIALGLASTQRSRAQARTEAADSVEELKRRAEQILRELSQTYADGS